MGARLVILAAACLLCLAPNAAAAGFLAPVTVEPDPAAPFFDTRPDLAVDPNGNAVAAWVESDGAANRIRASYRPAGGSWTPSQLLDTPVSGTPQVAVATDATGNSVVVWTSPNGGQGRVYASYRPAGAAAFGSLETVQADTFQLGSPDVVMDGQGNAIAGYQGIGTRPAAERRPAAAATWTADAAFPVTGGQNGVNLELAIGGDGVAWMMDQRDITPGVTETRWFRRPAGAGAQAWTLEGPAGSASANGFTTMALDSQNNMVGAWTTEGTPNQIRVQTCPADGVAACSNPQLIPTLGGADASEPALAADGNGGVTLVYESGTACATCTVGWARRPAPGAAFGAPAAAGTGNDPHVAADSAGTSHMLYISASQTAETASLPAGSSSWSAPSLVSDPAAGSAWPRIAISGGHGAALWTADLGVASAAYDAVAPAFASLAAPASGQAGTPLAFSASGTDAWGPLTVNWDFGDGQQAEGGDVSHAYGAAGTYSVVARLTDGAGNAATDTRTVTVTQAPLPPPLPPPVVAKTANIEPVSGVVRVRLPGTRVFVPLSVARQIPIGSIVDARKGRVRVYVANGRGGVDFADFYEGMFQLLQKAAKSPVAELVLYGGSFRKCPAGLRRTAKPALSRKKSVRHLWGEGKGRFRTRGRFSAATLRGTTWLTDDRCEGTRTRVTKGAVNVRDFVKRRTVVLRAPRTYTARPRARRRSRAG